MIIIAQILIIIFVIWSAIQQGHTHQENKKLTTNQRKKWHRTNFLIYCGVCLSCIFIAGFYENWWKMLIASLLIRVAFFDYFYSRAADLDVRYIGDGLEFLEGIEVKIFGHYGGIKKLIIASLLLITLNALNYVT